MQPQTNTTRLAQTATLKQPQNPMNPQQAFERFFTPTRRLPTATEQIILDQAEVTSIASNQTPLTLFSWGTGSTVLLVHGWGGCGAQLTAFVPPLLDLGYCVLACDLPAHGQTAGEQTNAFELAAAIQMLAAQTGKFDGIIAHSWGAAATIMALSEGVSAQKVVCLSAACWLSSAVRTIAKLLRLPSETEAELRRLFELRFGEEVWQRSSADLRAARLSIPGLLFHDCNDRKISHEESRAIAQAWSGAELVLTAGLGHERILQDQQVIQQAVAFIEKGRL
jgi:pimeloyl-ACP methyl ester carboxylesterase